MNDPTRFAKFGSIGSRSAFSAILAVFMFVSLASGCSNPLGTQSNVESGHSPGVNDTPSIAPAHGAEFVSNAVHRQPTVGQRFLLEGALASPTAQVVQKSSRGYTLYSNVQGEITSNQ
jgi:hypothetical protein